MSLKLITLSLIVGAAVGACGSSTPNYHTGDRIMNPNRLPQGQHVRILEVGEGDKQFDESQSFKGVICTVGKEGLRNDWSDGYWAGLVDHCSNGGRSYRFTYVRVEAIEKT